MTANKASAEPVSDDEMAEWSAWAIAQVERIDPILTRSFLFSIQDPGEEPKRVVLQTINSSQSDLEMAKPAWHPNQWYTRLHR